MPTPNDLFTRFVHTVDNIPLPSRFTFPFYYQPHRLCEIAAEELQAHLSSQSEWNHDFGLERTPSEGTGKMFGVLVVKNSKGELGYLSAFSGKVADSNHLPHFVPPVFDMLIEEGFFKQDLEAITQINKQVNDLVGSPLFPKLKSELVQVELEQQHAIEAFRTHMIETRAARKKKRSDAASNMSSEEITTLNLELGKQSVAEKNQLKYLKQDWENKVSKIKDKLSKFEQPLEQLKLERKQLSNALQHKLFEQYQFLNITGESKSLNDIFKEEKNPIPPAGSGECAAPKLLHYAFTHRLIPIALAEFWWGASPKSEIRQHKKFYPSCQSKCQPILGHMLKGLEVDDNPLLVNPAEGKDIEVVYQDDAIVVINKPAEFLSVPGRHITDSAFTRVQALFPNVEGPFALHRLDMSTSGLLVFALTRRANKNLQKQFITRQIEKRYVALLDGVLEGEQGEIHLPLRGDLDDRPRQIVCREFGKAANTQWQLLDVHENQSRVYLYPKTGRTHQLRVHCAHQEGLNLPIVGDDLYGKKSNRLHLHAEYLSFTHPYTKLPLEFRVDAGF